MVANLWATMNQRSQLQARQRLRSTQKWNLTSGCCWILTSSLSSKYSIFQDKHRTCIGHSRQPLDHWVLWADSIILECAFCKSEGTKIASKTYSGINQGEDITCSMFISPMLCGEKKNISQNLKADKSFAFQPRIKDHFCSIKKNFTAYMFYRGRAYKKCKTCCFIGLQFYI